MADSTTNLGFTLPRYQVVGNNSGFPTQVQVGTEGSLTYPLYSLDYEYAPPWFSFIQANAIQDLKNAMVPSTVQGMTPYSAGNWMNVQPIADYSQQFGILTPGQGTNLGFPGWYSNAADIPGAGGGSSGGNQQYANVTPFTPNINGATTNVDLQSLWAQFQDSLGAPNQSSPLPLDLSKVPGVGATRAPTPVSGVDNLGLTTAPTIGTPPLPQQPTIGAPPLPEYPAVAGPPTPTPIDYGRFVPRAPIPGGRDASGNMDVGPLITGTPTGTVPPELAQTIAGTVDLSKGNDWGTLADVTQILAQQGSSSTPFGAAVNYTPQQISSLLQAGVPIQVGETGRWVINDGSGNYRVVSGDYSMFGSWFAGLPNATRQAMATAINAIAPTYQTQDVAAYPNANIIGGVNYGAPVPYTYGG